MIGGFTLLAVAGCGDSEDPVAPASSSSSVAVTTTVTSSSEVPAPAPPTTSGGSFSLAPSDVPSSLTVDLEGTPCVGVNNVEFDGKRFDCVNGVFRQQ